MRSKRLGALRRDLMWTKKECQRYARGVRRSVKKMSSKVRRQVDKNETRRQLDETVEVEGA